MALTSAQERSAHATLRSAETRNRALREEMARLKGSVAQVRAQCATDIRRRDSEIQRLKRHLEGRRGRDGASSQVGVVVVTPVMGKMGHGIKNGEGEADLDSPEYSLKQETTEFLTQLSQGLSDENDALIGLVRGTLATLRSLQGLSVNEARGPEMTGGVDGMVDERGVLIGPPSFDALATSTDEVLEHLRGLLTNPSFVPLEEVELREEEIHRLRQGWEMMAVRWKEAVALMGGWKKRMLDEGNTINLEDLTVGLQLGKGLPSAQEARESPFKNGGAGRLSTEVDDLRMLEDGLDEILEEDVAVDAVNEGADIGMFATGGALREKSANARSAPSPRKVSISTIVEEDTKVMEEAVEDVSFLDISTHKAPQHSPPKVKSRMPLQVCWQRPTKS